MNVNLYGTVSKINADQQIVYGWFSVIEDGGEPVIDSQGDMIDADTLTKAAHGFVLDARVGKLMHQGECVADVVESMVFTHDLQKALGIDLGKVGWFGGMKVHDANIWKAVKAGKLPSFSIGGTGRRVDVEA